MSRIRAAYTPHTAWRAIAARQRQPALAPVKNDLGKGAKTQVPSKACVHGHDQSRMKQTCAMLLALAQAGGIVAARYSGSLVPQAFIS
ncbi:MAG TPA: hypothetical protein VF797_18570, partial [Noviherbaspirillum sp.]